MRNIVKILVVDDEVFNRILLEDILHGISDEFDIISASSGKAALEMIMQQKPQLVFLDLRLPDIAGWDILNKVRDESDTRDTKIIITTGCSIQRMNSKDVSQADAILCKPFRPSKVSQVVNSLMGGILN